MLRQLPVLALVVVLAACSPASPGRAGVAAPAPAAASPPSSTPTPAPGTNPSAAATAVPTGFATAPAPPTAISPAAAPLQIAATSPASAATAVPTGLAAGSALTEPAGPATPASSPTTAPSPTPTVATPPATSSPPAARPAGQPTAAPSGLPAFSHVFIIVLENREASQIVGNPDAPYLNQLAKEYARATNYFGVSHPSLPNYLALIGGDTFGVTSDCTDCTVSADNIVTQLDRAGRSWRAYMESMPEVCFPGAGANGYAQKHNPFIYFDNVRTYPARCKSVVPLTGLDADLHNPKVPDYIWITPNLCNDMHDCPVATGDAWLQAWVPKILSSPAWQDGGVLFITFDEGTTATGCCQYAAGGRVDTLVISPLVRRGFVSQVPYSHYSLLRTIEQAWALPLLGKAACDCSAPMTDFFAQP